jgi:hypothetical protein
VIFSREYNRYNPIYLGLRLYKAASLESLANIS